MLKNPVPVVVFLGSSDLFLPNFATCYLQNTELVFLTSTLTFPDLFMFTEYHIKFITLETVNGKKEVRLTEGHNINAETEAHIYLLLTMINEIRLDLL